MWHDLQIGILEDIASVQYRYPAKHRDPLRRNAGLGEFETLSIREPESREMRQFYSWEWRKTEQGREAQRQWVRRYRKRVAADPERLAAQNARRRARYAARKAAA